MLVLAGAPACTKKAAPTPQRPVRLGLNAAIVTLDPTFAEGTTFSALSNIFEGLVSYDTRMSLTPGLSISWSTPDETTRLLELRRDVKFHDGSALRAEDVVKALDRARNDPESEVRGHLWSVASVTAPDNKTLKITTSRPNALLLHELTNVLVAKGDTRKDIERTPLWTGSYRVKAWKHGAALELAAFPEH